MKRIALRVAIFAAACQTAAPPPMPRTVIDYDHSPLDDNERRLLTTYAGLMYLLTIEATGDFDRAKALLVKYGKETDEMRAVNATLNDIPVDLWSVFPAEGER